MYVYVYVYVCVSGGAGREGIAFMSMCNELIDDMWE